MYRSHKHGIIQKHSTGHIRPAWRIRAEPGVQEVFAALYDCDVMDLTTSFDAVNLSYPARDKEWYHTDQGNNVDITTQVDALLNCVCTWL